MTIWVIIHRASAALILGVVVVWAGSIFYPKFKRIHELGGKQRQLEQKIEADKEILSHLQRKQERLINDPRFVEKIAREELGLAKEGETVIKFVDDPTPLDGRTGNAARTTNRP